MSIPLVNLFQFMLFILCSLLAANVVFQRKSTPLAVLLFLIGLHAGLKALEKVYGVSNFGHSQNLIFLYGPLFYLMVKGMLNREPTLQAGDYWHGLPYCLSLLLSSASLITALDIIVAAVISQTIYIALTLRILSLLLEVIRHTRSSGLPDAVIWLKRAVLLYLAFYGFMIARFVFSYFVASEAMDIIDLVFFISVSLMFAWLIFQALKSAEFMPDIDEEDDALAAHINNKKKRLIGADHDRLVKKIDSYMHSARPFTNPHIAIKDLALQLDLPARKLSELINDQYAISFSEYINRARVLETQRLMENPGWVDQPLLDIALAAGFNSKSSFNLMFKRFAGVTPSDYRKRLYSGDSTMSY